jgi:hypothetical protein
VAPAREPRPEPRPASSTVNVGALLRDREFIKVTTYPMPLKSKRHVLEAMERLRRARMTNPPTGPSDRVVLPEMTSAELVREINWRLGTLPPDDTEAIVRRVRRMTQWQTERKRRGP